MVTFGEWVKEKRIAQGLTITACAERAGMKWQAWQRIEQDEPRRKDGSMPQRTREIVKKVAEAVNSSYSEALKIAYPDPDLHEKSVVRDGHLTYELSEDERQEIISSFEGIPPSLRPGVKKMIAGILETIPNDSENLRTYGKRTKE